jgi:hypothetical protein
MIEGNGLDPELVLSPGIAFRKRWRLHIAPSEGLTGMELGGSHQAASIVVHGADAEIDRVFIEQVPGEAADAMLNLDREAWRTDESQRGGAVETEAEQAVEACDVIHMGVRDEHMAYPQQLAGGEAPDIA